MKYFFISYLYTPNSELLFPRAAMEDFGPFVGVRGDFVRMHAPCRNFILFPVEAATMAGGEEGQQIGADSPNFPLQE